MYDITSLIMYQSDIL